jgi:steroid delta-isomerase-like uncharacterized protein
MRSFYEDVFSAGKLEKFGEYVSKDVKEHEEFSGLTPDFDGVKAFFATQRSAFPDTNVTVHEMLAEGDLVAARITVSGTHKGDFIGIPATGKTVDIEAMDIVRIKNGKIEEHWGLTDTVKMMQQLGVMPEQPGQ